MDEQQSATDSNFDALIKQFVSYKNLSKFGISSGKIHRKVKKKADNKTLYILVKISED